MKGRATGGHLQQAPVTARDAADADAEPIATSIRRVGARQLHRHRVGRALVEVRHRRSLLIRPTLRYVTSYGYTNSQLCRVVHKVTTTTITRSCNTGATTLSRMSFSGYLGHATIFSWRLTIPFCLVVGLGFRIRIRIRFTVWLVSGYARVFVLLSVVIVTLPTMSGEA